MAFDIDSLQYQFGEPVGMELLNRLSNSYSSPQKAADVADEAGLKRNGLFLDQAPRLAWREILKEAARQGLLRHLVEQERDRIHEKSPYRAFFEDLLKNGQPFLSPDLQQGKDGRQFISGDDTLSKPEALLYYDDQTLPIGKIPGLIATLQGLLKVAPAVCRMDVTLNGWQAPGTGFRIGADLLLTNWHVLFDSKTKAQATVAYADFLYEDDSEGGYVDSVVIPCDLASIKGSEADDWAVIRTLKPLDNAWPVLSLEDAVAPVKQKFAYIIQHPVGGRKRIGFVRNQIADFNDRVVHYLTDTQGGSSGSPVFDADCRLIAIHHMGGTPQTVVGKPPLIKNEGIRISRVLQGLKDSGIDYP